MVSRPSNRIPRPRRWLQYGLRTAMLLTLLCSLAAGAWNAWGEPYRQQRRVAARILEAGGAVKSVASGPRWLREAFGEENFHDVVSVDLGAVADARPFAQGLLKLPRLQSLTLSGQQVADEHVLPLAGLKRLNRLVLSGTGVSPAALDALNRRRPNLAVVLGVSFDELGLSDEEIKSGTPPARLLRLANRRVRIQGYLTGRPKAPTAGADLVAWTAPPQLRFSLSRLGPLH